MKHVRLAFLAVSALSLLVGRVEAQSLSAKLKAEGVESLAKAAREKGSALRGAILFPQQKPGCTNCHTPGAQNLLGPDLTGMGKEATDIYLVEAMLFPSKVIKKGYESTTVITQAGKIITGRVITQNPNQVVLRDSSPSRRLSTLPRTEIDTIVSNKKSTMPDGLIDQLAGRQQFLDLLRYTMELKAAGQNRLPAKFTHAPGGGSLSSELQGLVLMDEFQCSACHRSDAIKSIIPPKQAPRLAWGNGRIDPNHIERFIADPLQIKPGTTMPDVMSTLTPDARRAAANEITHYLVSLGGKTFQRQSLNPTVAKRGGELFHTVGCVACHAPRNKVGVEQLSKSSVPLGMLEKKYNLDGLVAFLENPHAARPSGRMPNMQLSHWEAIDLAQYLLGRPDKLSEPATPFQLDRTLVENGKRQFNRLGCIQCHSNDGPRSERRDPVLTTENSEKGCLSGKTGTWPRFNLDESQRRSIRAAIERAPHKLTDQQQIAVTLTTFKCVSCHQRDELGGVAENRDDYFHTENPNLGPQGRIPPRLTGVGAKLKPKWLRQVLVSGRVIRPYMKTRMPQYGRDNVSHLVETFQRVDRLPVVTYEDITDTKETRNTGHEMAGTQGLNCIVCHTFQQKRASTMPAVDLTEMSERLHKDWFFRYMQSPQRYSTNTIMPSFWPGGHAIRKDILDGDMNRQIAALWQYLLDGRQARPPRGLIREPIELVVINEAVMLRRNYEGIGKRGIGVGYPNGVNLAFDAEQMRLAMIWKGKFADPGGVWRGQGSGRVRPLGNDLIRFTAGPEFDDATHPWQVDENRPPLHRFRGYYLDSLQRPTFMYRFDNVDVEDYPIDVKDKKTGIVLIRRTLTFSSRQGRKNVTFRAAANQNIAPENNGTFLIGKTLRIHIDDKHDGQVVKILDGKQLTIPLNVTRGQSKLVLEYRW